MVSTPTQKSLYILSSFVFYYLTSDHKMCQEAEAYLNKQMKHSKLIHTSGEKENRILFNKVNAKIEALKHLIQATQILDFE